MSVLYTYVRRPHTVLTDGIKTPLTADEERLFHYAGRAQSCVKKDVLHYLESVFTGRSKALSCLTEKAPQNGNPKIEKWAESCDCFAFSPQRLSEAGLIEAVVCADNERLERLSEGIEQIDFSPLAWETVDPSDNVFFKRIRHYFIVLKDGVLPPKYVRKTARF